MKIRESTSTTVIWILLLSATAFSYALGHIFTLPFGGAAIILIAFAKARVVGLRYMDLRHAISMLRFAFEAWIAGLTIALIVLLR